MGPMLDQLLESKIKSNKLSLREAARQKGDISPEIFEGIIPYIEFRLKCSRK